MKSTSRTALLVLILCVVPAAVAVAGPPPAAEPGPGVTVVIEVFSGRPNPAFALDDPSALRGLGDALGRLPAEAPEAGRAAGLSRLGYRGIVIDNPRGVAGIPRYVQVLDGLVLVRDDERSGPRYLRDSEAIEKSCLALAVERGLIGDLIAAGRVPDPAAM